MTPEPKNQRNLEIPGLQLAIADTPNGLDVSLVGDEKFTKLEYIFPNVVQRGETLELTRLEETELEDGRLHSRFFDAEGQVVLELVSGPPRASEHFRERPDHALVTQSLQQMAERQSVPPFLCQLIDALAFGDDPCDWQEEWSDWKAEFENYFERENDYALSAHDARVVQNLPPLLTQLELSVKGALNRDGKVEDLFRDTTDFFEAYNAFFAERETPHFVQSPNLDRLLKTAIAHLQGHASQDAFRERLPAASLAIDSIHNLYLSVREKLPEEVVESTAEGFERARKGLDLLSKGKGDLPREVLEDAVLELRSAGELLEHLPNLFQRRDDEQGSAIPIIGPVVTRLREKEDTKTFKKLKKRDWPALIELWESREDGWMLDPEVAEDLIAAAEQNLLSLSKLIKTYPDCKEEFWETMDQLEETFGQIRENRLDVEILRSSPYQPEAQLLLNLLKGRAPVYMAQSVAGSILEGGEDVPPVIRAVGEYLTAFVAEPDPLQLLQALKLLLTDLEQSRTRGSAQGRN